MTNEIAQQIPTWKKRQDPAYQRAVDDFVRREVIYCVSSLIYELSKDEKYMDELAEAWSTPDYEEPVSDYLSELEITTNEYAVAWLRDYGYDVEEKINHKAVIRFLKDEDLLEVFAQVFDIDPQGCEVFEHWIVTSWLAKKLTEHGENTFEFMGMTIWARTTTGQSISIDGVICDIYDEVHNEA